ncbi:hypothetical protein BJF92_16480 [Rhizobium rhizosphaerae]|uniref:Antitoxin n=1 Tax=Xaviernesmea rhizosphaerae TaxID=1672749 RepID=A0A1Q9APP1_9HYPH|nr:type II toxin-antitoxin system prevent-host-death family antitoxin [Xaviernesmea rhizosphaerae]OLP57387.1 hypothetical protein BJF92_16480 [Xaviernesmea rhizosphaerae]
MRISLEQAAGQLSELVRLAEEGEEIVLTENGAPRARLEATSPIDKAARERFFRDELPELQRRAASRMIPGPDAAHSQDFLYDDETGLPA